MLLNPGAGTLMRKFNQCVNRVQNLKQQIFSSNFVFVFRLNDFVGKSQYQIKIRFKIFFETFRIAHFTHTQMLNNLILIL